MDVQVYPESNEYLVCCAKTGPSTIRLPGEDMRDGKCE